MDASTIFSLFLLATFKFFLYTRNLIHDGTISLKIPGILRLEVSIYNCLHYKQFQTTFTWGGGGGSKEVIVNSKEGNS